LAEVPTLFEWAGGAAALSRLTAAFYALWAFDLGDADSVRTHAGPIIEQLEAGRMPCYGRWPVERVALFRAWIEAGMRA